MTLPQDIPVVILCGGRGTRIRDVADDIPKPMIRIGRRPILWHIMKTYSTHGFRRFIVCLGFKGYIIKEYFWNFHLHESDVTLNLGDHRPPVFHRNPEEDDWEVTLVETGLDTQTGSRIRRALRYVDTDVFMMSYGDGVGDIPIGKLLAFHQSHDGLATLTAVDRPASRFGEITSEGDLITSFSEKQLLVEQGPINGGYMVMDRRVKDYIANDTDCILEIDVLPALARDRRLCMFRHTGFRHPMDTYKDWEYLNRLWRENQAPWKVWSEDGPETS